MLKKSAKRLKIFVDISPLDDDSLKHVFTFFTPKQLLDAGLVCKKFNEFSHEDFIWKQKIKESFGKDITYTGLSAKETYKYYLAAKNFYQLLLNFEKEAEQYPEDEYPLEYKVIESVEVALSEISKTCNREVFANCCLHFFPDIADFKIDSGDGFFTIIHIAAAALALEFLNAILKVSNKNVNTKLMAFNENMVSPLYYSLWWNIGLINLWCNKKLGELDFDVCLRFIEVARILLDHGATLDFFIRDYHNEVGDFIEDENNSILKNANFRMVHNYLERTHYKPIVKKFVDKLNFLKEKHETKPEEFSTYDSMTINLLHEVQLELISYTYEISDDIFAKHLLNSYPKITDFKIQVGLSPQHELTFVHICVACIDYRSLIGCYKRKMLERIFSANVNMNAEYNGRNPILFAMTWPTMSVTPFTKEKSCNDLVVYLQKRVCYMKNGKLIDDVSGTAKLVELLIKHGTQIPCISDQYYQECIAKHFQMLSDWKLHEGEFKLCVQAYKGAEEVIVKNYTEICESKSITISW